MTRLAIILGILLIGHGASLGASKATPGTVQLKLAKDTAEGRVVIRDNSFVWLYDRSGRLQTVRMSDVKAFKQISNKFEPLTPMALSTELLKELGKDYETATTRHYVVAAAKGKAKTYVELFDNIYRNFHMYFSVRGFDLQELEFPLVAIVFPDRQAFLEYAKREGTDASRYGGYYSPRTNRAVLFEDAADQHTSLQITNPKRQQGLNEGSLRYTNPKRQRGTLNVSVDFSLETQPFESQWLVGLDRPQVTETFGAPKSFKSIGADQRDTMIHECTHQVAFNVGMHDRVGQNPKWIVEGLATVFEAPGIRNRSEGLQIGGRINQERLTAFKDYLKLRRPKNSLESTIGTDELFNQEMSDFYAEAWALSFFLVETRPRKYSDLLRRMATRDGSKELTRSERIETFRSAVSDNFKLLDAEFVRFYEKLK